MSKTFLGLSLVIVMIIGFLKFDYVVIGLSAFTLISFLVFLSFLKKLALAGNSLKERQRAQTLIAISGFIMPISAIALCIYLIINFLKLIAVLMFTMTLLSILSLIILKLKKR